MRLQMPSPMKRSQSSIFQFRRRIPSDVLAKAPGVKLAIPVGDRLVHKVVGPKTVEIGVSLGTREPREAKTREAEVAAYLDEVWETLRSGKTMRLTKRQAVALSGEVYRTWLEAAGDDPGPPELWAHILETNRQAFDGDFGRAFMMITQKARREVSLEDRFGGFADWLIAKHGLVLDDGSRRLLVEEVAKAMDQVSTQLARHAQSDFRPDPDGERFPPLDPAELKGTSRAEPKASELRFDALIDARWREAKAAGSSPRTLSAWRSSFKHLKEFLGHDDAAKVTKAHVVAFKDHRLAQGASVKTVRDSDLAALKSTFGWAVANGKLANNPAEGVTLRLGRPKDQKRPKGFTDEEANAILQRAKGHTPSASRRKVKSDAAIRWVPWLLAFTGARVGEISQLRKEDVFEQAGRWVIRITPDAGAVKTGQTRLVPLHRQLVEDGFVEFVQAAPDGHLFVSPKDPSEPDAAVRDLNNRLRLLIREVVPDEDVQPFHAWRHRFMTLARELGCDDAVVRSIVGHSARDVHDRYGDSTIKAMGRVIDTLPGAGGGV